MRWKQNPPPASTICHLKGNCCLHRAPLLRTLATSSVSECENRDIITKVDFSRFGLYCLIAIRLFATVEAMRCGKGDQAVRRVMLPISTIYVIVLATLGVLMPETTEAFKQTLNEGERISNGQYLMVPDNSSLVPPWLAMQRDCNFVLYDQFGQPAWNSVTETEGLAGSCYATVMDCNLLVYAGDGKDAVLWNSTTTNSGVVAPCYATILLPGTNTTAEPAAVLYDSTRTIAWSSQ